MQITEVHASTTCQIYFCQGAERTMSRMLLMPKSLRMFLTEEYSLQSSGRPNALLASTVSKPSSCTSSSNIVLGEL